MIDVVFDTHMARKTLDARRDRTKRREEKRAAKHGKLTERQRSQRETGGPGWIVDLLSRVLSGIRRNRGSGRLWGSGGRFGDGGASGNWWTMSGRLAASGDVLLLECKVLL